MNDEIMKKAGFGRQVELKKQGLCPWCESNKTKREDFRDEKSWKECGISGLCQDCQDEVFNEDNE